jgi:hypothetical protein
MWTVLQNEWNQQAACQTKEENEHAKTARHRVCQLFHYYNYLMAKKWNWRTSVQCLWTLLQITREPKAYFNEEGKHPV